VDQSVAQRDAAQIKWTEERGEMFVKQCHDNEMAHNRVGPVDTIVPAAVNYDL